jgi:excisionase family DNA binding protein
MTNGHQLLTARQVAERFNVSVAWVLDHAEGRHKPVLPSLKLGRSVRFRAEDLEQFLETCRRRMAAGLPLQ